jgi:dihydrolipoamide dehydrogenase
MEGMSGMTSSRKREKQYDLIVIGSGSAMNFVDLLIQQNPDIKIAVIDKDETGGICLTRGCIPSKIMLYPAELVRMMDGVAALGIDVEFKGLSFEKIMARTRSLIDEDID